MNDTSSAILSQSRKETALSLDARNHALAASDQRLLAIMDSLTALYGYSSIASIVEVDGHYVVRFRDGHVILDPEDSVGLILTGPAPWTWAAATG